MHLLDLLHQLTNHLIDFADIKTDRSNMHLQQIHNLQPKLEMPQRRGAQLQGGQLKD
jgi:hypothetical protein